MERNYASSPIGIIQAKDMLDVYLSGQNPDVRKLVREAPIIPELHSALDLVAADQSHRLTFFSNHQNLL